MQWVASSRLFYVSVEQSWQWNLTDYFHQLCKPRRGFEVNLRQAENKSFFHCLAHCTVSQTCTDYIYTHTFKAQKHIRNPWTSPECVGGERKVGETNISLERDWCDLFRTSLFEDDLSEQPVLSRLGHLCVCVYALVCVSQQRTMSIKERNCSIILATATNQLVHLCPSQLFERTWTNSASTHRTGCLFVHCISPAEWIDPFTSKDTGMKGNKMCIL